ncbi:OmpA family protein [Pseudooceanicola sp.]|uniref:OmpA family protein n=1 Tax=Pseudooceanicola sp. TaxID=1914328 RepID=UPI00260BA20E|nr:OmpA family protein [Pseudooceanicola sp.]MDF1856523.1 OmpA family protein [Pseudooceanicola sp.]
MRLSSIAILAAAFVIAAVSSLVAAGFAVSTVEAKTETDVRMALDTNGLTWAEVQSDGLRLHLTGIAPSEAVRFRAISVAGAVIDASRVIDGMQVKPSEDLAPPRFSVEILRNETTLSLIGLIPTATDRAGFVAALNKIDGVEDVADLLDVASHPMPEGWKPAIDYALKALAIVPRSKISVEAGKVSITAMSDSAEARKRMETQLKQRAPKGLLLTLAISAPRPVIAPFTLRFLIEDGSARFDACSADTEKGREAILNAARAAGLQGEARCTIGLGVPSTDWSQAAEMAITALAKLGSGSVTFADADITLIAAEGTAQGRFDDVVGALENDLPDVFALHAVLPEAPAVEAEGPPDFTATLSPEGLVQLRGRLNDELTRKATESYAKARFGAAHLHNSARLDGNLPADWPLRVLTALEALSKLSNGAVIVTPDNVSVSGNTGQESASDEITGLLSKRLGNSEDFTVNVTYLEKLDPEAARPEPEACLAELEAIQKVRKISFEPGSAKVDSQSLATMNDIAETLKLCGPIRMEIGGHTDSQGRETMNQQLSQARAQAVLNELRNRRILTASYTAKGYGETAPIASNKTEEGREENRRIEFKLLTFDSTEEETTLESIAASAQQDSASDTPSDTAEAETATDLPSDGSEGSGDE